VQCIFVVTIVQVSAIMSAIWDFVRSTGTECGHSEMKTDEFSLLCIPSVSMDPVRTGRIYWVDYWHHGRSLHREHVGGIAQVPIFGLILAPIWGTHSHSAIHNAVEILISTLGPFCHPPPLRDPSMDFGEPESVGIITRNTIWWP